MLWKFLDPTGATYFDGKRYAYILPRPDQKWSDPTLHPEPGEANGEACGAGGFHGMKKLSVDYAPHNWWPWAMRGEGVLLGEDDEKARYTAVRLRLITPRVFARCLRPPFNWGKRADLRLAHLRYANLRDANLEGANLRHANLRYANLWRANLAGVNLRVADLQGANLAGAVLRRADLWRASLVDADLWGANLRDADLEDANLEGANLRAADLGRANLGDADLWGANLRLATLEGAEWNTYTVWPAGFEPPTETRDGDPSAD